MLVLTASVAGAAGTSQAVAEVSVAAVVTPSASGGEIAVLGDTVAFGGKDWDDVAFTTEGGKDQEDVVFADASSSADDLEILFSLEFGGDGLLRADGMVIAAFAPGTPHDVRIDLVASDGVWYAHARVVQAATGALVAVVTRPLEAAPTGAAAWGGEVLSLTAG